MSWPHMLFYSGEVIFVVYDVMNDVMNDVADFIFDIRRLMRFAPDCQEHLRMQSLFELYRNSDWEMMKLV